MDESRLRLSGILIVGGFALGTFLFLSNFRVTPGNYRAAILATVSDREGSISVLENGPTTLVKDSKGNPLFPKQVAGGLSIYSESPPVVINNNLFVSTGWTYKFPYNPVKNFINNVSEFEKYSLTSPNLVLSGSMYSGASKEEVGAAPFWKKNYYGALSFEESGGQLFALTHGENTNASFAGNQYTNDIHPEINSYAAFISLATSKDNGNSFTDLGPIIWPSDGYFKSTDNEYPGWGVRHPNSIIAGNYMYIYYQEWNDRANKNTSTGVKLARVPLDQITNPSAYTVLGDVANNTWNTALPKDWYAKGVYVTNFGKDIYSEQFKQDFSKVGEYVLNGEKWWSYGNNWLAKLSNRDINWYNYGNGWMSRDEKVAKGFTGFNKLDDYTIKGGLAASLFNNYNGVNAWYWPGASNLEKARYHRANTFSVAKIKGTDYYIGVEDAAGYISTDSWQYKYWIDLRISKDLIHWSKPYILEDTVVSDWNDQKLAYTKFLNADFTSNKEIDANAFYLTGSNVKGYGNGITQILYYKKLGVSLTNTTPLPTAIPTPIPTTTNAPVITTTPSTTPTATPNATVTATSSSVFTPTPTKALTPTPLHYDGRLIRATNSTRVYFVQNGQRRWVSSLGAFRRNNFSWRKVLILSPDIVNSIRVGRTIY